MPGFLSRHFAKPDPSPPPDPSGPQRDWFRESSERLSIVEGELAGIKVAMESLSESMYKVVAKWSKRSRDEAKRLQGQADESVDPRIRSLLAQRGRNRQPQGGSS